MKRIFYLVVPALLILASCSADTPSLDNSVLLKRIIYSVDINRTIDYTYDGNKIKSYVSSDGQVAKFTYTGNVISKREYFHTEPDPYVINAKDTILDSTDEFYYVDGKLATEISKSSSTPSTRSINTKSAYTYNTDGTVIAKVEEIDTITGAVIDSNKYGINKFTYKHGNLIAEEYSEYIDGVYKSILSDTFEYDTKYNPFNNILGYNLLIGNSYISTNNVVKINGATINYKYNSKGFPIVRNDSSVIKYFY